MLEGRRGSLFALTETLTRATPLILTGLAAAVAFRARLCNIGAEGQLYAGALAAVAVGSRRGQGRRLGSSSLSMLLAAAALPVPLLMLGPTLLKVRLGVDEVVTTLLLNFVVLLFVQMMLEGPLKDPMGGGWPQSEPMLDAAVLPPLVERMRLHAGLVIGIVAVRRRRISCMARTVLGLQIRAVGDNATAAALCRHPMLPDHARRRRLPLRRRLPGWPAPPRSRASRAISRPTCRAASAMPASSSPCSRGCSRSP